MKRYLGVLVALVAVALSGGCGSTPEQRGPRPSGSTDYFFSVLDQADAVADYFTLPRSLADTLPNRTYTSTVSAKHTFTWTQRFVVGRVTSVSATDGGRVRLRLRVEESFPAMPAATIDVLVAGNAPDQDRYLASAASLDRVLLGIDSYEDDDGALQTVVGMASQLFGVVDGEDRISYPVLNRGDFENAAWDRDMTTLSGLRTQAAAAPSTITFGRG